MSKVPVLVTGGAGYIGSHAVLALRDAGWPVAVIDDLSNGTRAVVPDDVPFFEGSVADRALVDRILQDQKIGAILHFAGSIVVPELVEKPLDYYANNTLASHALIFGGGRRGRARTSSFPRPPRSTARRNACRSTKTTPNCRSILMARPS